MTSFASRFLRACRTSVRVDSARWVAAARSIGSGRKSGRSTGSMVERPQRIVRAADDEALQRDLGGAPRALGRDERLPLLRGLRLRLDDVDGRHRADFDFRLIVPQQLFGERERLPRDVDRLHREHVVPVRIAHVGDRVDRDLLQLDVGDVLVDAGDEQLLARRIDSEVAQQRLRVLRRPRRVVLRVDRRVQRSTSPSGGCRAAG